MTEYTLKDLGEDRPFCKTIPEAVEFLEKTLPDEIQDYIRSLPKDDLILLHLSLGMWIRNNIPVWGNKELLTNYPGAHPDDISHVILIDLWEILKEKENKVNDVLRN